MKMGGRIGIVVTMAAAAVGVAAMGSVTAASAATVPFGPRAVDTTLQAVPAITAAWVNLGWKTNRSVCDVEVRVAGQHVKIDYPGRKNYTSFTKSDSLRAG